MIELQFIGADGCPRFAFSTEPLARMLSNDAIVILPDVRGYGMSRCSDPRFSRFLARFAAGAVVGAPAGYVSHTLADAQTARGIPLLTKGF
jgi:hypothetical protein